MSRQTEPDAPNRAAPSRTAEPPAAPARPEIRRPAAFDPNDPNPPAPPQPRAPEKSDAGFGSFG